MVVLELLGLKRGFLSLVRLERWLVAVWYCKHGLGGGMRAHKIHELGGGTRAHKVQKGCWQVGGTTGTGVLWGCPVPSWGVS